MVAIEAATWNEKMNASRKDAATIDDEEVPYQPVDLTGLPPKMQLPDNNIWMTVLESPCSFTPEIFDAVMLNLIKNPNLTSSHLFRGDILYDNVNLDADPAGPIDNLKDLETDHQPRRASIEGFRQKRTMVRRLIPRNPQLDKALIQTCHFFQRLLSDEEQEQNVVLYIPHVDQPADMPFYHPPVAKVAFQHIWHPVGDSSGTTATATSTDLHPRGVISLSYALFPPTMTLTPKLERTALKLHQTIHKHGQGQLAGFTKRVHLDQLIPQKRYQDTYTRLKAQYGRRLSEQWIEVTDPGKHVFEDIGIAAFLIELWTEMYHMPPSPSPPPPGTSRQFADTNPDAEESRCHTTTSRTKPPFPGFVDIGCGNGVLVYILLSEGYRGWGFDARRRKTWSIFPDEIQAKLQQRLLVPKIFQKGVEGAKVADAWHDGVFDPETFIISNHADELTAWTPLLAYQNDSFFISIPCCSHDLTGARFRAPATTRAAKQAPPRLPQQDVSAIDRRPTTGKHASETGSLKRTEAQKKMPSAYSSLCSYVTALAQEVNYVPEREVLRIPSTRNQCIIGRKWRRVSTSSGDRIAREQVISTIVAQETGKPVKELGKEWIERAVKLSEKPGSGH